ncbi:MAG TPA: peptidylprolyl isomerase [Caulobacteraceae bacterium]
MALACAALAACNGPQGFGRAPEKDDRAVAKVDGETVWASDVRREAQAQGLIGEGEALPVSSPQFGKTLDQVVDQKLMADEAAKRRLDRGAVAQRRLAAARERVLSDLLLESVVAKAVDEQAVQRLYREQVRLGRRREEMRLRQVVTATGAEAQTVRRLIAGGASIAALALERSTDAETRFSGGDLGYVAVEDLPPGYAAALREAQAGALVGPFPVSGGFAVVRVEDRRTGGPPSFAEARPQIVRFLTYDEIRDLLARLRDKSKVQVLIPRARSAQAVPPSAASAPSATPAAPQAAQPQAAPMFIPPGGTRPTASAAPAASSAEAAR